MTGPPSRVAGPRTPSHDGPPHPAARNPSRPVHLPRHGVWRSLVAHSLWERGAVGSNPATPTRWGRRESRRSALRPHVARRKSGAAIRLDSAITLVRDPPGAVASARQRAPWPESPNIL